MNFKIDGWNNFCRVFEIPEQYPEEFCFGGGINVNFKMVDWFNPIPGISQPAVSKATWEKEVGKIEIKTFSYDDIYQMLVPWLQKKQYIKSGVKYLILCDFGVAIQFNQSEES